MLMILHSQTNRQTKFRCSRILLILSLFWSSNCFALDAGEHALIGDLAFVKANAQYSNNIKNLEANISFSYGQLMAMSADMYSSVEEISLDDPSILNGFFHRNRESLKKCINKEIEAIRSKKYYKGCDDLDFAKKKIQYVSLAHDNFSHFAWHNIKQYIELHEQALWFAELAFLKCTDVEISESPERCQQNKLVISEKVKASKYRKKQKSKYRRFPKLFKRKRFTKRYFLKMPKGKMVRLALFTNAFADHFLTDTFSAGHLRVPRSQIDQFVEQYDDSENKKHNRDKGSSVSGALTQYLHNLDGNLSGIPVENSIGMSFVIRSDKQLFSKNNSKELSGVVENNENLTLPVLATVKSVEEIFSVVNNGKRALPKGVFDALNYVPFITDQKVVSLSMRVETHIKKHGSIKKAIKNMSSEMQLIYKGNMFIEDISYKKYFKYFVSAIPDMMADLRNQIKIESENLNLKRRIPKKLMNSMINLR